MSSVVNYFKDRAHRVTDYPNVIMNYWNRSAYVKPAVLFGAAALSDRLGGPILPSLLRTIYKNIPGPFIGCPLRWTYLALPVKPAVLSHLATIVFGFGLAASAHKNQISHLSEPEIQRATFWRRFGKTLGFIGGTFIFPPLSLAAAVAKSNSFANAETISASDDVEDNPLDADFEPREEIEEASEAEQSDAEEVPEYVDEKRQERDERDLLERPDERSASSSSSSASSRLEEVNEDEAAEVESASTSESDESDLESETSDEEENNALLRNNRQQGVVIHENRQLRLPAARRIGWEAAAENKLKRIARPLTNLCKKNAAALVVATTTAVAGSVFALSGGWETAGQILKTYAPETLLSVAAGWEAAGQVLKTSALETVLSVAVPATGVWISPSSLSQQPEFAAGALSVLGTLVAAYPKAMLAATSVAAVAKLGSIAKDYFFNPEPQPVEPGLIQE